MSTCVDDSLNFEEKQAKYEKLRAKVEDYAARVFQCCARCKMAKRHLLREVQHYSVSKRKRIVRRDSASAGSTEDNVKFENPLHGEDLVSKLLYVTPLRCTCTPSSLRPGSLAYMYAPDVKCVRTCYVYATFAHTGTSMHSRWKMHEALTCTHLRCPST